MSDTPIIDIAFCAGCPWYTCEVPNCQPECNNYRLSALEILRAALLWDLPAERLEAMARTYNPTSWAKIDQWKSIRPHDASALLANCLEFAIDAYRADPLFKELYPEKFA